MSRVRIALATKNGRGVNDELSDAFGRSEKITVLDVEGEEIVETKIIDNPALSFRFGAGPILVKVLLDLGVDVAVGSEFGPGAGELLRDHGVTTVLLRPGTKVSDAARAALDEYKKSRKAGA